MIDTNNHYAQRDEQIAELDNESTTTSQLLQKHLPTSKVVKAFNHIPAAEHIQRDTPGYRPRRNADKLKKHLAAAKRHRDL